MPDRQFDVVIIGGGIHGAGAAQAAVTRGYSVLVLEQSALAAGTSSRSSKLIHGGLRYLEGMHLSLVRECLRERALLLKLAPELVRLQPFHVPVYSSTRRRPWQLWTGLGLYALLGGNGFNILPRSEWKNLDGIATRDLQAVFRYQDAQTDDAALTRAVMHSAQRLGAELQLPAALTRAELTQGGVIAHYQYQGTNHSCKARVMINAAGPWVNQVLARVTPQPSRIPVDLVQGTHIILPGTVHQGIYYVEAPRDHRAVFVMPWKGQLLVGTTEKVYRGDPAAAQPSVEEIDYLLETLGRYFPQYAGWNRQQISDTFAGLRVLPAENDAPFARSRETILHTDRGNKPRLLTIYGGKLTSYRATAEKVMQRLAASLPPRRFIADTRRLPLQPV